MAQSGGAVGRVVNRGRLRRCGCRARAAGIGAKAVPRCWPQRRPVTLRAPHGARHGTKGHVPDPMMTTLAPPRTNSIDTALPGHALKSRRSNTEKDSLEISLRMADWLALHAR